MKALKKPAPKRPAAAPGPRPAPKLDAQLRARLDRLAAETGRSDALLLNEAVRYYLDVVVPRQNAVRPEVMRNFARSMKKNRRLLKLLGRR